MNLNIYMYLIFILTSLYISFLDIRTMHISLIVNYVGFFIILILYLNTNKAVFINHISGAVIFFLLLVFVRIISHKGLGWGDIHYGLFCGLFSGVPNFIFGALLASFSGIIYMLIINKINKMNIKRLRIPFIPFMFLGCLVSSFIPDFYNIEL